MCLDRWCKDDRGFSLIEVVLAVAILALVALPIVNYFTYSSVRTIEGRDKQTATTVAEDVMEELRSYSNYDQIKVLLETPDPALPVPSGMPLWSASLPEAGATPDPQSDYMERHINVDGFDYLAKVQIQYGVYNTSTRVLNSAEEKVGFGTGDVTTPKFNDYYIPSPSEVYSPSNVVATEDDQIDAAVSEFLTTFNASAAGTLTNMTLDKSTILAGIDRKICIDISYEDISSPGTTEEELVYVIRVYYEYEYSGSKVEVNVQRAEIEPDKFERIFIFYNPLPRKVADPPVDAGMEDVRIRIGSEVPGSYEIPLNESERLGNETVIEDMEIYFAAQTNIPTGYNLYVSGGRAINAKYFANGFQVLGSSGNLSDDPSIVGSNNSFVQRRQKERIGRILVDIYETAGTKANEVVAHMETTLAE